MPVPRYRMVPWFFRGIPRVYFKNITNHNKWCWNRNQNIQIALISSHKRAPTVLLMSGNENVVVKGLHASQQASYSDWNGIFCMLDSLSQLPRKIPKIPVRHIENAKKGRQICKLQQLRLGNFTLATAAANIFYKFWGLPYSPKPKVPDPCTFWSSFSWCKACCVTWALWHQFDLAMIPSNKVCVWQWSYSIKYKYWIMIYTWGIRNYSICRDWYIHKSQRLSGASQSF